MNLWIWLVIALVVAVVLFLAIRRADRQRRTPSAMDARDRPRNRATGLASTYYKEL